MKGYEKQILQDLYESISGLYAFTFYSRYKINPSSIFNFIEEFTNLGIINYENDRLSLTEKGREFTLKSTFIKPIHPSKFSNIPMEVLGNKIAINEPYLPNKTKVPKEIIKIKKVE